MSLDIVHDPSSRPTRCAAMSEFVQVMTSPTLACTGPHWKPPTVAWTVVVPVESAHTAEPPVLAAGAALPGGACVPAAVVGAEVAPAEQAARATAVASVATPRMIERMWSSGGAS